jgi:hypothetical protein
MGASVVLLEPTGHVGGMATEGGIGLRDRHWDNENENVRNAMDPRSSQVRWGLLNARQYGLINGSTIWQPDNYVGEASFLELLQEAGVEVRGWL